jgi:hypothetical protein
MPRDFNINGRRKLLSNAARANERYRLGPILLDLICKRRASHAAAAADADADADAVALGPETKSVLKKEN